jgi:hypothetical protein
VIGQLTKDRKEMENMATDFFKDLYTVDERVNPESLTGLFRNLISEEMNRDLCKYFTDEEISDALFQIGPLKAPTAFQLVSFSATGTVEGGCHKGGMSVL